MKTASHRLACALLTLLLAPLAGCRDADLLYYYDPAPAVKRDLPTVVKEVVGGGDVNLLWVIDNSYSMDVHQSNVRQNANLFMQAFRQAPNINWKMGLISSDTRDAPYVGLAPGDELLSSQADPIPRFRDAVGRLGTNGDATEKFFDPTINALTRYPGFLFPSRAATLAIIFVTDTKDQSVVHQRLADFLTRLRSLIGTERKLLVYGAFSARDLTPVCANEYWDYSGSTFEALIRGANGFMVNLCSPNFGQDLAAISKDIVSHASKPRIYLPSRPKVSTLSVTYQGVALKEGLPEQGGVWFYDPEINAIEFYTLDFAGGGNIELVDVKYVDETTIDP